MKRYRLFSVLVYTFLLGLYFIVSAEAADENMSENAETEIAFVSEATDLKTDTEYMLKELPWKMSPDEFSEKSGIKFDERPIIDNEELLVVGSKDILNVLGYEAMIETEFHENKFAAVTFRFLTKEAEKNFIDICEALQEEFGDPSETNDKKIGDIVTKGWLWSTEAETKGTVSVLQVVLLNDDLTLALGLKEE